MDESAGVTELSLWIQDTWRVSSRLTLTAGLRWEFSPAPVPDAGTYFLDYVDGNGPAVFRDLLSVLPVGSPRCGRLPTRDFAPRLGLAWRLTGDGKTVLRAGGGLYYDSSMSIAADSINGGPLSLASYEGYRRSAFVRPNSATRFCPTCACPPPRSGICRWSGRWERTTRSRPDTSAPPATA